MGTTLKIAFVAIKIEPLFYQRCD